MVKGSIKSLKKHYNLFKSNEGVCRNPKDIPPDDLDDVILGRMIKEAGVFYQMKLGGPDFSRAEIRNGALHVLDRK